MTGAPELLIVMGATATPEQVDEVVARLEEAGCAALVTPGREATVIGGAFQVLREDRLIR